MVRCSKCSKSFKQHNGINWQDNKCKKCWHKDDPTDLKYTPPLTNTRLLNTPIDFYLDQYTQHEVLTIDR